MKVATVFAVLVVAVLLIACGNKVIDEPLVVDPEPEDQTEPTEIDVTAEVIAEIEGELSTIDNLDDELDFGDLDDLETDLDQI